MTPNQTVTDDQDRPWSLGRTVARGSWFRSWLAEGPEGRKALLLAPLAPTDLGGSDALAAACRQAMVEAAGGFRQRGMPEILGKASLDDAGSVGLLIPVAASLQQRLDAGSTLVGALSALHRAAVLLEGQVHGDLHPDTLQVLPQDGGPPEVRFGLPLPRSLWPHLAELDRHAHHQGWRPPEAHRPEPSWDTWALCRMVWLAAATPPGDTTGRVELPEPGPDKVALAGLRDKVMARLAHDQSNPRFRARVADRLAALLNRGLSREHEPSPPYRFSHTGSLAERLVDVMTLVNPRVTDVGRVMLGDGIDKGGDVFESGSPVKVSVSVACSHGQADHEDLVAGLRLVDRDAPGDGRVPLGEAKFAVKSHPSGRLRFEFTLPSVAPGRYQVRAAFAVKDSGDEPKVSEGRFEVRPAPGYVPPAPQEPGAAPIRMPERGARAADEEATDPHLHRPAATAEPDTEEDADEGPTVLMDASALREALRARDAGDPTSEPEEGAELIEGFFPKPVAPPSEPEPRPLAAPVVEVPRPVPPPTEPEPQEAAVHTFPGAKSPREGDVAPPQVAYGPDGERVTPPPLAAVPTAPPTEPSTAHTTPGTPTAVGPGASGQAPRDDFSDATGGMETPSLGSAWMAAGEGEEDTPYQPWSEGPSNLDAYSGPIPGDPTADLPTEDLPTYEVGRGGGERLSKLKEMLFRDTTTAVGVATAASLLLVLLLVLALKVL